MWKRGTHSRHSQQNCCGLFFEFARLSPWPMSVTILPGWKLCFQNVPKNKLRYGETCGKRRRKRRRFEKPLRARVGDASDLAALRAPAPDASAPREEPPRPPRRPRGARDGAPEAKTISRGWSMFMFGVWWADGLSVNSLAVAAQFRWFWIGRNGDSQPPTCLTQTRRDSHSAFQIECSISQTGPSGSFLVHKSNTETGSTKCKGVCTCECLRVLTLVTLVGLLRLGLVARRLVLNRLHMIEVITVTERRR